MEGTEQQYVADAFASNWLSSVGPHLDAFEAEVAATLGGGLSTLAVSSGTAALHLGVRALGWGEGDEVLTSPFSFVASANCLLYERARPVFCDVDPITLGLDPAAAEAALGPRTAGILPIHIFGYPAAMGEIGRSPLPTASASSRTPARLSGPSTETGARSGRAATRPASRSTPTSR